MVCVCVCVCVCVYALYYNKRGLYNCASLVHLATTSTTFSIAGVTLAGASCLFNIIYYCIVIVLYCYYEYDDHRFLPICWRSRYFITGAPAKRARRIVGGVVITKYTCVCVCVCVIALNNTNTPLLVCDEVLLCETC